MKSGESTSPALRATTFDAHPPAEIAHLVEAVGVRKAKMPPSQALPLAFLAGAFIAIGAALFTIVITGTGEVLGVGLTRWVGGISFSIGLVLVIIAGAELFTGNILITMTWAAGKVSVGQMGANWFLVYLGNLTGALCLAVMVFWAQTYQIADGAPLSIAVKIAQGKVALTPDAAFARGVLCNVLVCLAVWLCFAAHSVAGKVLVIVPPIAAFVALGFEHSIANMFFIPVGMLYGAEGVTIAGLAENLVYVTLGNVLGGASVGGVYWLVYLRHEE